MGVGADGGANTKGAEGGASTVTGGVEGATAPRIGERRLLGEGGAAGMGAGTSSGVALAGGSWGNTRRDDASCPSPGGLAAALVLAVGMLRGESGNSSAASAAAGRLVAGLSVNLLSDCMAGGCGLAKGTPNSASALLDGLSTVGTYGTASAAPRLPDEPTLSIVGLIDWRDGDRANRLNGSSLGAATGAGEKPEKENPSSCGPSERSCSLAAAARAAAALSMCARRASGDGLLYFGGRANETLSLYSVHTARHVRQCRVPLFSDALTCGHARPPGTVRMAESRDPRVRDSQDLR